MRSKSPETMQKIISAVDDYYIANGHSPSITSISNAISLSRGAVHKYLVAMTERGMIQYDGKSILTDTIAKCNIDTCGAAILDNSIPCGEPIVDVERIEEYIKLPTAIFGKGDFYVLRTIGDSMIDAGIEEGDMVVIKKQNTAKDGDIVVALVDGANTLKRFTKDDSGVCYLKAENDAYDDIYPSELFIQGVATFVIKPLS